MTTKHKWHKEIKAWADGAEIEGRNTKYITNQWMVIENPNWNFYEDYEYRIKPQPKEPQYFYVWRNHKGEVLFHDGDRIRETPIEYKFIGKIKLEEEN